MATSQRRLRDEWLFGYGSLVWRPDFPFVERRPATIRGWGRRFWQASPDHRGVPAAPGRVVTLVADAAAECVGMAYRIDPTQSAAIWQQLDFREREGYAREQVMLNFAANPGESATVYRATAENAHYLGPAPLAQMVAQVAAAAGPSGTNVEYVLELAAALVELDAQDEHVAELAAALRAQGFR